HDVGHLGREHVISPAVLGLADHPGEGCEIAGRLAPRTHGDQADAESRLSGCGAHAVSSSRAASRASSRPAASSACRSSLPPTWVLPMKICGTVVRPLARSIIAVRSSGRPVTLISVNATPLWPSRVFAAWQ